MKTYIFRVEIEQEEDGRWSADIPALPGCAAWGYSKEEAIEAIQDTAKAYLEVLIEDGRPLPEGADSGTQVVEAPMVAVTL